MTNWDLAPGRNVELTSENQVMHMPFIHKLTDKNHTIILIDAEKAVDKIQNCFMI